MGRVVIPVGPQHPALKEPANFTLFLEGEKIAAANDCEPGSGRTGAGSNHQPDE